MPPPHRAPGGDKHLPPTHRGEGVNREASKHTSSQRCASTASVSSTQTPKEREPLSEQTESFINRHSRDTHSVLGRWGPEIHGETAQRGFMTSERELAQEILMYITEASNPWRNGGLSRGEEARADRMEGRWGTAGPRWVEAVSTGKAKQGGHGK